MKHLKLFENKDYSNFFHWLDDNNMNLEIIGSRKPGKNFFYYAIIVGGEIKKYKSNILSSGAGYGDTPDDAIENYINNIQGKIIVVDAYDSVNRKEYEIPENFELYRDIKKYNL